MSLLEDKNVKSSQRCGSLPNISLSANGIHTDGVNGIRKDFEDQSKECSAFPSELFRFLIYMRVIQTLVGITLIVIGLQEWESLAHHCHPLVYTSSAAGFFIVLSAVISTLVFCENWTYQKNWQPQSKPYTCFERLILFSIWIIAVFSTLLMLSWDLRILRNDARSPFFVAFVLTQVFLGFIFLSIALASGWIAFVYINYGTRPMTP